MGDLVSVDYTGTLQDGTVFDSSRPAGKPLQFRLGGSQVIKGFERGIVGMKPGGVRRVTIPPDLGYGKGRAPAGPAQRDAHLRGGARVGGQRVTARALRVRATAMRRTDPTAR